MWFRAFKASQEIEQPYVAIRKLPIEYQRSLLPT